MKKRKVILRNKFIRLNVKVFVVIPADLFIRAVFSAVTPLDILAFTIKIGVGGLGLFLIACYQDMSVGDAPTDVPAAVSRASLNASTHIRF